MSEPLGLAEVVASLRYELYEALHQGAGQLLRFEVGPIDLEFHVQIAREAGGGGKVRFWVVELGAEGKVTSASTQVIKLRLDPKDAVTGKSALVADDQPRSGAVGPPSPTGPGKPVPASD